MNEEERPDGPVWRAIKALKEGRAPDEKCIYCNGIIDVIGSPPGGTNTIFHFQCPCKKTAGVLYGL